MAANPSKVNVAGSGTSETPVVVGRSTVSTGTGTTTSVPVSVGVVGDKTGGGDGGRGSSAVGLLVGTGIPPSVTGNSTGTDESGVGFEVAPAGGLFCKAGPADAGDPDAAPEPVPVVDLLGSVVVPAVGTPTVGVTVLLDCNCKVAPGGTSRDWVTAVPSAPNVVMMIETVQWVDAGDCAGKPRPNAIAGSIE